MSLPPFPAGYRASGLLLHVTSLPSPYGIGDVGPTAVAWVDRLHETGQGWWQALPLGPTGYGDSPYQSLSSFAGNPLLISSDWLIEDGLVRAADCAGCSFSPTTVDFDAVKRFKFALLETAWKNFSTGARSDLRPDFEHFGNDHAHWLDDYALFRALKARYAGASYLDWPEELIRRTPAALDRARRALASQVDRVRFVQFVLFRQGARLKAHARARGVRLIGDLPFFVSPDSSDVWAHPELFLLDAQHRSRVVAGWHDDLSEAERRNLWRYLKRGGGTSADAAPALLRLAWSSVAALAIAPLQDVLNLGKDARMNQPGTAQGNWRWRSTEAMLSTSAWESLRDLTHASARSADVEISRPDASIVAAS